MATKKTRTKKSSGGIKSTAINIGGQTRIVEKGSKAESQYLSQGGTIGTESDKSRQRDYLKSLNKKGSPNYISQPGDEGYVQTGIERVKTPQGITETQPQQPVGAAPTGTAAVGTPPTAGTLGAAPTSTSNLPGTQAEMLAAGAASSDPARQAASRYSQAVSSLPGGATGLAPAEGGQARAALTKAAPQPTDTATVDAYLQDDPVMANLMSGITQLLNPKQQTTTLVQDYKKLYQQSGLGDINEEIIDAETIINGTEDDIRNEVQMAGGFATESQVQAMALSRNKSLLTRYNQLVQMKTDATNQLNTMMNLSAQDKQMAQTRVNQQISNMFNLANFRQQAMNNTREQYKWLTQTMGADGLYNALSQDPRQLAFAEKILGTGAGGLRSMAAQAAQQRQMEMNRDALDIQLKQEQIKTEGAQRTKIYADIAKTNQEKAAADAKVAAKVNASVAKAGNVANALKDASKVIGPQSTGWRGYATQMLPSTDAYALRSAVTTIKANLGFDELQKMRENSPTGGALGSVAVQELEALQATVANLDLGQSETQLRENLNQVYSHYRGYLREVGYELTPDFQVVEITQ